jgi:hypothetical protein
MILFVLRESNQGMIDLASMYNQNYEQQTGADIKQDQILSGFRIIE